MKQEEIRNIREAVREADKRACKLADKANERAEAAESLQEQNMWLAIWNRLQDACYLLENAADEMEAVEKTLKGSLQNEIK